MNRSTHARSIAGTRLATVAAIVAAAAALAAPVAAQSPLLTLPSVPWYVATSAAPNLLLTLDDSGSMQWAYAPDSFYLSPTPMHYAYKSNLNPLYYDETVTYDLPVDANGAPYATSFSAARRNGFDATRGTVDLATSYRPDYFYDPSKSTSDQAPHCRNGKTWTDSEGTVHDPKGASDLNGSGQCAALGVAPGANTSAYYFVYVPNGGTCATAPRVEDIVKQPMSCYTLRRPTTTAERQNFANWYSFYRTRNLATVSATMLGFSKIGADYRIAWQALNSCKGNDASAPFFTSTCAGWDGARTKVDARIGVFTPAKRADLWTWLERLPADSGTPLRSALVRAGEYTRVQGPDGVYADQPRVSTTTYQSCRSTYAVTMTDGIWNSDTVTAYGNADSTARTLPDGRTYSPRAPFRDAESNSLSDIAFHYWANDLQPSIANGVLPYMPSQSGSTPTDAEYWDPRNDPATWQKMTSIFVGLSLNSWLVSPTPWMGSTFDGTTGATPAGYPAFATGFVAWPDTGDDKAPANVYDLWHGAINSRGQFYAVDTPSDLVRAFEDLRNRIAQREEGAAPAASSSLQVQADSLIFVSSFRSVKWDGVLKAYKLRPDGSADPTPAWTTENTFDTLSTNGYGSHTVYVRDAKGGLARFDPTGLGNLPKTVRDAMDTQANALGVPTIQLIRWILGENSDPKLRKRERLLGDLINSAPVYEGGRDYGYGNTAWTDSPRIDGPVYAAYLAKKKAGAGGTATKPTVYVGSNDGMLHAFDAATGQHRFAYIPTPAVAKLGKRAEPLGGHTWYVDGPLAVHDVHDGTEWRTILVASMGAGARGLFALDVTDPDAPSLLWEWFPTDTDLGFVMGEPVIARADNGQWIVAFGNGYSGIGNKASLYVLEALTGTLLRKIDAGPTQTASANGLSSPALLYTAGRRLSFAYAGDLFGNLWRFDLRGPTSSWSVSNGGLPLFTATGPTGVRQPITAKPRIASDRTLGRMILFGTGRLLAQTDPAINAVQSIYGIRDRGTTGTTARSGLVQQRIVSETGVNRTLSSVDTPLTAGGWYIDLAGTSTTDGERVTTPINYMPETSLISVSTVRPVNPANTCVSSFQSWLMFLSPFTGKQIPLLVGQNGSFAGYRMDDVLAAPTPVRRGSSRVKLSFNAGAAGLTQIDVTRGWNPRAAWQQVR